MQVQEQQQEVMAIYFEHVGTDDVNYFEDAFCGIYEDRMEFVCSIVDEMMPSDAPDFLKNYFDYNSFCRDLFIDDYFSIRIGGVIAVFRNILKKGVTHRDPTIKIKDVKCDPQGDKKVTKRGRCDPNVTH